MSPLSQIHSGMKLSRSKVSTMGHGNSEIKAMKRLRLSVLSVLVLALSIANISFTAQGGGERANARAQSAGVCPQMGGTFTIGVDGMVPFDPLTSNNDWSYYV